MIRINSILVSVLGFCYLGKLPAIDHPKKHLRPIGVILGLCWGYIGIMEQKLETTF